ncbi:MAG: hypothetical protein HDKAJFGB_01671 [Anaerolineae bacterium]|nr:hypothetical protein [Anaerolineae bacterium]
MFVRPFRFRVEIQSLTRGEQIFQRAFVETGAAEFERAGVPRGFQIAEKIQQALQFRGPNAAHAIKADEIAHVCHAARIPRGHRRVKPLAFQNFGIGAQRQAGKVARRGSLGRGAPPQSIYQPRQQFHRHAVGGEVNFFYHALDGGD